jgi:hypothetical protein
MNSWVYSRDMKSYAPLRLLPLVCILLAPAATGGQGDAAVTAVPSLVEKAALAYAAELHGAIGMQRHFSTTIKAGPVTHTETSDSGILFDNGTFVKIKYYRIADDGKAFSAAQILARESETNTDWSAGKIFFKEPYDERYMQDYSFSAAQACSGCPSGLMAVNFTSTIQDAQHGKGIMWIDSASAHVTELIYTPNALPSHATSGSVTEVSSNPVPDIWYVTRINETYQGHELIVSGTGAFTGTFDEIRHFASLAQGQAALDADTI